MMKSLTLIIHHSAFIIQKAVRGALRLQGINAPRPFPLAVIKILDGARGQSLYAG